MHASCILIDDITRNFGLALILAVNFQGVTLENLSRSDQILMTFEKAEVCFSVAFIDLCFVCGNTVLSAVLFMAMIIAGCFKHKMCLL